MLLTIDAGNTQTVLGLYDEDDDSGEGAEQGLVQHWRVKTDRNRTADELAVLIRSLLENVDVSMDDDISGLAVSSGVPVVTQALEYMSRRYFDFDPVVLGPGVKSGMPILYDNPREVGADRIANAVGAYDLFGGPTVVVDFGTGNNFDVVSENGEFMGGAIAPGIEISLDALFGRAAMLGAVPLEEPRSVIGKNTVEALQSGAIYGFASQIDGMVRRFQAELGPTTVVSTGGLGYLIVPVSETIEHSEPFLTLYGLRLIHAKNVD